MFNNKKENESTRTNLNSSTSVNLLGVGTVIEGEISSEGDIRIDGKIIGTVTSRAKVVVGSTGAVDGDVFCKNADVSGKITGKMDVKELLFLKESAIIDGNISTNKLVVEAGAKFNGTCNMGIAAVSGNGSVNRNESKATATIEEQAAI